MLSKTREAFEKWAVNGGLHVEHVANIDFFYPGAFGIWQAAEAAALERAAQHMDARAAEFEACGNMTADTMARIYRDEASKIRALAAPVEREGDKS
jgi:hypothetical protein